MTASSQPPNESSRQLHTFAWLAGLAYFLVACLVMPDFGPTWDLSRGDYPYGDEVIAWWQSDVADFVEVAAADAPPDFRQPYPDYHKEQFPWYEIYPVGATLSGLSSFILWDRLGWVPAVAAHQIVIPLLVALMIVFLVVFLGRRVGLAPALLGVGLMVISPRFFTHSIHNLKDIPECVFYTAVMCLVFLCLTERAFGHWLWLGVLLALALGQKANALFLPVQALVFWLGALCLERSRVSIHWGGVAAGAVVFAVVYLAVSPAFWHDTFARIGEHFGQVKMISTTAELDALVPVDQSWMMTWSAPLNVLITTPLPVLLLALVGLLFGTAPRLLKWFLVLGVLFPICRLMPRHLRDFDGIRHFIEFYPCLCALAGLGGVWLGGAVHRPGRMKLPQMPAAVWPAAILVLSFLPGLVGIVSTYPYGTCYFNPLVGGLRGAQQLHVPEAVDYWATSYWPAADWLNAHAGPDAAVLVPIAKEVVVSMAPVRLRDDLRQHLQPKDLADCPGELLVMYITRPPFYGHLLRELERSNRTPVHEVSVQGAVILRIYRFVGPERARVFELLAEEQRQSQIKFAFVQWLRSDAGVRQKVRSAVRTAVDAGFADGSAQLGEVLPAVAKGDASMLIEWLLMMRRHESVMGSGKGRR